MQNPSEKQIPEFKPMTLLHLIISSLLFGFAAPVLLIGNALNRSGRKITGIAMIFAGFTGWFAYTWIYIWLSIDWFTAIIMHLVFLIISATILFIVQKGFTSGSPGKKLNEKQGQRIKLSVKLPVKIMIFWAVMVYAFTSFFLVVGGEVLFISRDISKTVFLYQALIWALPALPAGMFIGFLFNYRNNEKPLIQFGKSICSLIWSVMLVIPVALLMEYFTNDLFPYRLDFYSIIFAEDPISYARATSFLSVLSAIIGVGGVFYCSRQILPHRKSWNLFFSKTVLILVLLILTFWNSFLIENSQRDMMFHMAKIKTDSLKPQDWHQAIRYLRACVERVPEEQVNAFLLGSMESLYYDLGDREKSKETIREVFEKYGDNYAVADTCEFLEHILKSMENAAPDDLRTGFPLDDYPETLERESYTDSNWLAVLTVLRAYYPDEPEVVFKERLRKISQNRETILLPVLDTPLNLVEYMFGMDFETCLIMSDFETLKEFSQAGLMPILFEPEMTTILDYNPDRQTLLYYSYPLLFTKGNEAYQEQYKKLSRIEISNLLNESTAQDSEETQIQELKKRKLLREISPISVSRNNLPHSIFYAIVYPKNTDPGESLDSGLSQKLRENLDSTPVVIEFLKGKIAYEHNNTKVALEKFSEISEEPTVAELSGIYAYFSRQKLKNRIKDSSYQSLSWIFREELKQILDNPGYQELSDAGERLFNKYCNQKTLPISIFNDYMDNFTINSETEHRYFDLKLGYLDQFYSKKSYYDRLLNDLSYRGFEDQHLRVLEAYLKFDNRDDKINLDLAFIYAKRGRISEAETIFQNLRYLKPRQNSKFWYVRGELEFARGHHKKAARFFKKAIKMEMWHPLYHHRLSNCLDLLDDAAGAEWERQWVSEITNGKMVTD